MIASFLRSQRISHLISRHRNGYLVSDNLSSIPKGIGIPKKSLKMPRPNKKRKAILLAIAARGAKRRAAIDLDTAELDAVEEGISGPFVYSECEESLDELASECDDLEKEEQDEQDEQEIQDLNMTVDVYKELLENTINVDFPTTQFKYQRGVQVCRRTLWQHKKAQQELQHSL
ncbi:hypothetical protein BDZ91DRAFT_709896 [Kalaharituber pfeilii]|nr:hypothetical protein BDZ91DRAFT_709896 [Kalaharituber pfeilii]